MIRENQKIINILQMLLDIGIFSMAMASSYYLRFLKFNGDHVEVGFYIYLSIISIPIYLFIFNYYQLYESYRSKRILIEISRVIKANFIGIIFIFLLSFLIKEVNVSRLVILFFGGINTSFMLITRILLRKTLRKIRSKGLNIKRLLIVGYTESALTFIKKISLNKNLGYQIKGYISTNSSNPTADILINSIPYKGNFNNLEKAIAEDLIDEVIVALEYEEYNFLPGIIETCEKTGTRVSVIPFYTKYLPAKPYIDEVEGLPIIDIRRIPLDNLINNLVKILFDFFVSLFLLILFSPLLVLVSIGIKITSPGPILYKQERVGLNKKNFIMYKFRSMRMTNDNTDKTAWSRKNDPRKTKFGSFIRKYSIDELPQLFNVLNGTMSLVGPRPELPFHVNNFKEEIPLYMVKHQVRPGITGWAQVNGLRGDTSIKARIEHDIFYIENWSFMLDIKILIMTIFKGVVNKSE